eukprot:COSAG02_NODE_2465_length_8785_cov_21.743610_4_plen_57_part_00
MVRLAPESRARDIAADIRTARGRDRRIGKADVADLQVVALLLRCYTAASQVSGDLL